MKIQTTLSMALFAALLLAGCGFASDTTEAAALDTDRSLTGTLDTTASAQLSKVAAMPAACIGDICSVRTYGADGTNLEGELVQAENRWRIRVRNGNWMVGFLDGNGRRLGVLALNGIPALTVEEGDDVDVGHTRLRDGLMMPDEDVADLGGRGMFSYYGPDGDRDGLPACFDADDPSIDPAIFNVLFIRPFDAQPHVAPCRPAKIVFTMPLDDATVTTDTIKVLNAADESAINGTLSLWEDAAFGEYEVLFTPTGGYPMGAEVNVIVLSGDAGVRAEDGAALTEDVSTSFTVRDWGSTSLTCHDPDQERQQIRVRQREQEQTQGDGSGNPDNGADGQDEGGQNGGQS
jgi:hypothetical protein